MFVYFFKICFVFCIQKFGDNLRSENLVFWIFNNIKFIVEKIVSLNLILKCIFEIYKNSYQVLPMFLLGCSTDSNMLNEFRLEKWFTTLSEKRAVGTREIKTLLVSRKTNSHIFLIRCILNTNCFSDCI